MIISFLLKEKTNLTLIYQYCILEKKQPPHTTMHIHNFLF
jgi:hypothetical protein